MKLDLQLFDGRLVIEPMPNGEHWKLRTRPNAGSSLIIEVSEMEIIANKILELFNDIKGE